MILEIQRGQAKRLTRAVSEPVFLVGSSEDCDMVLGDTQFPGVHFYFLSRDGRTTIRRLTSEPELTINGRPHTPAMTLTPGDRIRTGPYEFQVKAA